MRRTALLLRALAVLAWIPCVDAADSTGPKWWREAEGRSPLEEVLGSGAEVAWAIAGVAGKEEPFATEAGAGNRPILVCGAKPVTLEGRTAYGAVEIDCRVQLRPTAEKPSAAFSLTAALDPADKTSKGIPIVLTGTYEGGVAINAAGTSVPYKLRAYDKILPTWDEAVRLAIERDMAALPLAQEKWLHLRVQLASGHLRVWVDDRLITEKRDPSLKTAGHVRAVLQPGTRLAELSVRAFQDDSREYEQVPLNGYARGRELVKGQAVAADTLPLGKTVEVDGVPFTFAARDREGNHLDLSRSLLRQANMEGYIQSQDHRFAGAMWVDPARIQLRIPNGLYDRLDVIAASDDVEHRVPYLDAMFYRPAAGFAQVFEAFIPHALGPSSGGSQLPVRLDDGSFAQLWHVRIPLDPARLASFSDLDVLELELTKRVHQYRTYPDPILYGWHGAGLPSGVHVYAITLHRASVAMSLEPNALGHVWTAPAVPGYTVAFENTSTEPHTLIVQVKTRSHEGDETSQQMKTVNALPNRVTKLPLALPVRKNGWHELTVTMHDGVHHWTETRGFVRLAKDTRAPFWEEGEGPLFGYWSYHGGHYTPSALDTMKLMHAAGARGTSHIHLKEGSPERALYDEWKWRSGPHAWPISPQRDWAGAEPLDPAKYDAYKATAIEAIRKVQGDNPELVTFFPEPHISRALTAGNLPEYWGDPPYEMNSEEQTELRTFFNTAKAAAEAVRATWPKTKILVPWGDPLFVPPVLRAGFPKNLIDGSGLDIVGFERLPEAQLYQMTLHRLYELREEYRKYGKPDPLLAFVEGVFVPTEAGACTWEEQAERYHRSTLISLAYGVERFYSGWFSHDCGNYYGSEHYGGCGIFRRIPYSDPKPAYAHFATTTRMLERSHFERWLPTGSLSVYALKFNKPEVGPIYALWTLRGERPVTLKLTKDAAVSVTDSMDNATLVKSARGAVTVTLGTSPIYVTGAGEVQSISLGEPDHYMSVNWSQSRNRQTWHDGPAKQPAAIDKALPLANLGDGSWRISEERDAWYENIGFDWKAFPGKMSVSVTGDPGRPGQHLAVHLLPQDRERRTMPWYTTIVPAKPIEIAGKSAALGLWVKAASDWGRVVYCLRDAKGERWVSAGAKDQFNCNDPHSWSCFNFDGWRYLRFELPAHAGWDSFREYGTTWWGSVGGDGIVDLPLRLEKIIVERRTHAVYVNDVQPANPADVLLGELVAEYERDGDATFAAVEESRLRMPAPREGAVLSNPITKMEATRELPAVKLESVRPPDWGYDGTRCHVNFSAAPEAAEYQVWVSAYPDGRGAVQMGRMKKPGELINNLRPGLKLYFWVTYTTAAANNKPAVASKPSNPLEILLVDAFSQK